MKLKFEVIVVLKEGLLDPQGKAVRDALPTLGWSNVSDVRIGKSIFLTVESDSPAGQFQGLGKGGNPGAEARSPQLSERE